MIEPKNTPLTDDEVEYLGSALESFPDNSAMNLEEVDGFFAALICSPRLTMPSEYLPEVYGGAELSDSNTAGSLEDAEKFLGLLMQQWNHVSWQLRENDVFLPLLLEDGNNPAQGNDWAIGFQRGMLMHQEEWKPLWDNEEKGGLLMPILALANEHHPDPELRTYKEPVTPELRDKLILGLSTSTMGIFRYFQAQRLGQAKNPQRREPIRRKTFKVGRNAPCPCGSGRKYKICCGNISPN